MGAWGIKALERDEGLDVLDILKNEYVPEHPVMDSGQDDRTDERGSHAGFDFYKSTSSLTILRWLCGACISNGRITANWATIMKK